MFDNLPALVRVWNNGNTYSENGLCTVYLLLPTVFILCAFFSVINSQTEVPR